MRSGYKELSIKLDSFEESHYLPPKKNPMVEENRDDGEIYPIKLFLKESLMRQRNKMMDNFSQVLRQLPMTMEET
jgi:hypothetical protein